MEYDAHHYADKYEEKNTPTETNAHSQCGRVSVSLVPRLLAAIKSLGRRLSVRH